LLAVSGCAARATQTSAVEYAKTLDVSVLDASLTPRPFEAWLKDEAAVVVERWQVSDCDLKASQGKKPACVKVYFRRRELSGFGMLRVPASAGGRPSFEYAVINAPHLQRVGTHGDVSTLSELPSKLAKIEAMENEERQRLSRPDR
jgi:hypothetical protein